MRSMYFRHFTPMGTDVVSGGSAGLGGADVASAASVALAGAGLSSRRPILNLLRKAFTLHGSYVVTLGLLICAKRAPESTTMTHARSTAAGELMVRAG